MDRSETTICDTNQLMSNIPEFIGDGWTNVNNSIPKYKDLKMNQQSNRPRTAVIKCGEVRHERSRIFKKE